MQVHVDKSARAEIPTMSRINMLNKKQKISMQDGIQICLVLMLVAFAQLSEHLKSTIPHLKPNERKSETPATIIPARIDSVILQLVNYPSSFSFFRL